MNNTLSPLGMDCRTWNGVEIQRRPSDGYVNATAMCQAGGKLWKNYNQNDRTHAYIAALAAVAGIPATGTGGLIQTIQGGPPQLQGTWIHPRLAVDLARWISPEFAVWMDGWFLDVMRQKLTGGGLVSAPNLPPGICWQGLAELYAADREDELRGLAEIDRPRSAKFSRPVAEHFIQWLLMRHGHVALPNATGEAVTVGFPSQQPTHRAPAAPPAPPAARRQFNRSTLQRSERRGREPFAPGYRIAAPELARLLGISPSALNYWARRMYPGAVRHQPDGTAWQLVGKGKIRCGTLGSTIPPGGPSWLFQRLEDHGCSGTLFSHSEV